MTEQTLKRAYAQFFALCERFRVCITKPDLSTLCFRNHKFNLHNLILHDFEKNADNLFTI